MAAWSPGRILAAAGVLTIALTAGCDQHAVVRRTGSEARGASPASDRGGGGFTLSDAGAGGGVVTAPTATDANNCGFQHFDLARRPAELILVLDRSGSMRETPQGGTRSKWIETTEGLDEVITRTQGTVLWGLKLFPAGAVTCAVSDGIDVPAALNNAAAVTAAYRAAGPEGDGTPTAAVIAKTVAHLQATPSTNARYLLLATDGQPTCADGRDGGRDDAATTVQAVAAAAAAGFHTFVAGIATRPGPGQVLAQLAVAGQEPRPGDPTYYPVTSRQDLIDTFGIIAGRVSDCVFPLDVAPPSPGDVAVNVGGQRIGRDDSHADGWDYGPDNRSVRLYGPACDRVKASDRDQVNIIFGCPGVSIP
jgi:hypothetical protein